MAELLSQKIVLSSGCRDEVFPIEVVFDRNGQFWDLGFRSFCGGGVDFDETKHLLEKLHLSGFYTTLGGSGASLLALSIFFESVAVEDEAPFEFCRNDHFWDLRLSSFCGGVSGERVSFVSPQPLVTTRGDSAVGIGLRCEWLALTDWAPFS